MPTRDYRGVSKKNGKKSNRYTIILTHLVISVCFQATVEDLDLLPALSIHPSTNLADALEMSYERSYSYLPVVSTKDKRLLGYLTAEELQQKAPSNEKDTVANHYIRFKTQNPNKKYQKITPNTPLEDLEDFFNRDEEFAVVTDEQNRFVMGVATKNDLDKFVEHRPNLK